MLSVHCSPEASKIWVSPVADPLLSSAQKEKLTTFVAGPLGTLPVAKQKHLVSLASQKLATEDYVKRAVSNKLDAAAFAGNASAHSGITTEALSAALAENATVVEQTLSAALAENHAVITSNAESLVERITTVDSNLASIKNALATIAENRMVGAQLLNEPVGVASTDLAKVRALLMKIPGQTLQADVEALNLLVDGAKTNYTTEERITDISDTLLHSSTGMVSTDLEIARYLLTPAIGANLQEDIEYLNSLLTGDAVGSTLEARISAISEHVDGNANGQTLEKLTNQTQTIQISAQQLSTAVASVNTLIGGEAVDIYTNARYLQTAIGGDGSITTGTEDLAKLIGASTANSVRWSKISSFRKAPTLTEQLTAFLALFQGPNAVTFDLAAGPPTSLADLLSRATTNQ
jgi:prefoldin subunit 5